MSRFNLTMSLQILVFTVQAGVASAYLAAGGYVIGILFALSTLGSGLLILNTWGGRPLKGFTPQTGMPIFTLNGYQLRTAVKFLAPDETDEDQMESELSFQFGTGHDGLGWYAWVTEYPEEGAVFLDEKPQNCKEIPA